MPLPRDTGGAFASGTGDVALYVQIALVPASALPPRPPPQSVVSAAFRATAEGPVILELVRGFVNPGQAAFVPPAAAPSLLLAADNPLRLEDAAAAGVILVRDESALLAGAATIRNDGPHPASFVAARIMANPIAAATPRASLHPAVNCLFLIEALACDGSRDGAAPPPNPCLVAARNPLCDGFAPERG